MPKFGLTKEQRRCRPWGLPPIALRPDKTITDPLRGDVFLTRIERLIVDSPCFQRLRRIKQLGNTHFVYPGATHTRFSHVLGALRTAQDLLDVVLDQRHNRDSRYDIFNEWRSECRKPQGQRQPIEGKQLPDEQLGRPNARIAFQRQIGEAVVLCRLAALLHDLCHVPFGHTLEDELRLLTPHDENMPRFKHFWGQLDPKVRRWVGKDLKRRLEEVILSKHYEKELNERMADPLRFARDLVGNTICSDLMDYLPRDHYYAGLPMQLGKRFLEGSYVRALREPFFKGRFTIRLYRNNRLRHDVLTELQKYLRYRYELMERVLFHHAKLAADVMTVKLFEQWDDALREELEPAGYSNDSSLPSQGVGASTDVAPPNQGPQNDKAAVPSVQPPIPLTQVESTKTKGGPAKRRIEDTVRKMGDDELLAFLKRSAKSKTRKSEKWVAVKELAEALVNRRLFKRVARCTSVPHRAESIHLAFGSSTARQALEAKVAKFLDVEPWKIGLWIPEPGMKKKLAQVVVEDNSGACELSEYPIGSGRDIAESHKKLWSIDVYVHPSVRKSKEALSVLLALLAKEFQIPWDKPDFSEAMSIYKVAADHALRSIPLTQDLQTKLINDLEAKETKRAAAASPTLAALFQAAEAMARELFEEHLLKGGTRGGEPGLATGNS